MAENDVTIQINVDAKDAQAAIDDFGRQSTRALSNTEKQSNNFFNTFKAGALRLAGPIGAVVGGFLSIQKGINEAVEDAKLTRQIEASLLAVGDASSDTVQGILDFADAIKDATGVSDDLVKSTFITAQNFGISTDKAKELTVAAIDLAAATGTDVESAVRLLGGTFDGTVGKLANYGEEFRNLTKEQLEAGDAIDIVSKKFGGSASKDLDTFGGRLGQLSNSFGDFLKAIGKTVTESPAVQDALKFTAEGIDGVTEALQRQKQESTIGVTITQIGASYSDTSEKVRLLKQELQAFQDINIGGQSKAVADGFAGIVEQAQGASSATADFVTRLSSLPKAKAPEELAKTGKALEEAKKKAEEAAKAFKQLESKVGSTSSDEITKIKARYEQERREVESFSAKYVEYRTQAAQLIVNLEKNKADEVYKYNLEQSQKLNDEIRKNAEQQKSFLQSVFDNPFGNFAEKFNLQIIRAVEFAKSGIDLGSPFKEGEVAASITGGLTAALQGEAGAKKALAQVAEGIGQSFGIPGLGAITELLSRGPEETEKFIRSFVEALPVLIEAIVKAIPVLVETLIDVLLFEGGLERIIGALIRATPRIAISLAVAFRDAIVNGAEAIGNAIGQFFSDALNSIFEPIQDLFKPLEDALNFVGDLINQLFQPIVDLIDAVAGAFGGKGGGRGLVAETFDRWFSKGGLVYAADGFFQPRGTDTVPAMLTPGELVVPRDMVGELGAFLNGQRSEAPGSDAAMLSAIYSAVSGPIVVKAEAKVNQQAFADIILQLNRQNARLTA
jgi:hypothetical protein